MVKRSWVPGGLVFAAALAFLAVLSCASPRPAATPTPPAPAPTAVSVREGESVETAVLLPIQSEVEGVAWENDWIYDHYGRFRRKSTGLANLSGRRYNVVTVELANHSERTIYFDVTLIPGEQ